MSMHIIKGLHTLGNLLLATYRLQHVARIERLSILATCCRQQTTWQLFDIPQGQLVAGNKLPSVWRP